MAKIHIGLVTPDKKWEQEIQAACQDLGGAYIHSAKTIFELIQKLTVQKVQVVFLYLRAEAESSDFKAAYNFLRGKRDLMKTPICILSENLKVISPVILEDPLIRAFPIQYGTFIAVHSVIALLSKDGSAEILDDGWVRSELLRSLNTILGQNIHFQVRDASEDERRTAFFSERADEVRSHLGWFKFTLRMLHSDQDNIAKMFSGLSPDAIEEFSASLLEKVVKDFNSKVEADFAAKGAIYLPAMEALSAPERKLVYGKARYQGVLFEAPECTILLEITRYF